MQSSPDMLDESSIELVDRMTHNWPALSELYVGNARIALARPGEFELWEKYAFACVARAHYTVESIFRLADREADMVTLTRVLYEHAVAFAWLMIDPQAHYSRLVSLENVERAKMVKGLSHFSLHGHEPEEATVALLAIGLDPSVKVAPDTFTRAQRAQEHWTARIADWEFGYARNYENMFRAYSTHVHPIIAGLMAFFDPTPGADPARPVAQHPGRVPAEAMILFVEMLIVAGESLKWPSRAAVQDTAFDGLESLQKAADQKRHLATIDLARDQISAHLRGSGDPARLLAIVERDGDSVACRIIERPEAALLYGGNPQVLEFLSRLASPLALAVLCSDTSSTAVTMGNLTLVATGKELAIPASVLSGRARTPH